MNGTTGPRDWTPHNAYRPQAQPARTQCPTPGSTITGRGTAWLSVLAGSAALVMGIIPVVTSNPRSSGFVLSTVGGFAIVLGLRAIAARRAPRLGWTGVIAGAVGTVLMLAQTIAFHMTIGGTSVPMPYAVRVPADQGVQQVPTAEAPAPPAFDVDAIVDGLRAGVRDFILSPAGLALGFVLLAVILCVGSVTSLRWLVHQEQRLRRRLRGTSGGNDPGDSWSRPHWERIDGTSVYRD